MNALTPIRYFPAGANVGVSMVEKRWLAAVAAVGVVIAGCGSDDNEKASNTATTEQPAGAPVATVNVSEVDFKLKPATLRVAKAGVVKFVASNDGKTAHSLEVEGPGEEKETKTLQPGQSGSVSVDLSKPGTYEMYCPIDGHKNLGMKGTVIVAGASGSAGQTSGDESSNGGSATDSSGGSGTTDDSSAGSGGSGTDDSSGGGY